MNPSMPWKSVLWTVWFGHFVIDLLVGIWPAYKTLAGLDLAKAGLIIGVSGLIGDGSQLFFGFLSDKGHRKKLFMLGIFLVMSSTFLALTQNYAILSLLVLLTYFGSGLFHPAGAGIAQTLIPGRKGFTMTLFASGGYLGLAITQLLFAFLYRADPAYSCLLICFVFLALLFSQKMIGAQSERIHQNNFSFKRFFEPFSLRKKDLTILYFSQLAQQIVSYSFLFFLPDVLLLQDHTDWICYGGGHCCYVIGAGLMMVPAGILSDRFGQRSVLLASICSTSVLFYVFLFQGVTVPWLVPLFLLGFGACMGVYNPIGVAFGNRLLPTHASSVSALLMGCVWCVAHVIGAGGGGLLTKVFVEAAPAKALMVIGLFLPISSVLAFFLPAKEKIQQTGLPHEA
ncbi:MAG: MFS transporter [Chlamydiales bacterium]|nr:MFS transporter [Chlamydiales bacterium]